MGSRRFTLRFGVLAAVAFCFCGSERQVLAQGGGNNEASGIAGVIVDANGVLSKQTFEDRDGQLQRQRAAAALAALDPSVARPSKLRLVSLNRLEAAVAQRGEGLRLAEEMRFLAGLTRIQYVFYYPDTKDIVLAGPAEGWATDLSGRVVGLATGRPVLELQDLVVALRAFAPDAEQGPLIGCSIDPTQEGLARMQEFLRNIRPSPSDAQFIVEGLRTSLGLQKIRVMGVPPDTHFAQVMVEADYRMKLIAIGLERPPIKLKSYVDLADPATANKNALQRWYFLPNYECVRASDDGLAMELVGNGVKLVGEDEVVNADGSRATSGKSNNASKRFVTGFTEKYPRLADVSPVYAQLRNLIDMTVAAAFIQQRGYYKQSGWEMQHFGSEADFKVQTYTAPVQVDTVVTSVWKGRRLMTPVGGGVQIEPQLALATENQLADEQGAVQQAREQIKLELTPGQWWWDAEPAAKSAPAKRAAKSKRRS